VVNQAPIGTPLSSRPNLSLRPGYIDLNPSIANTAHVTPGVSGLFVPPGHNVAVGSIHTLLFGGTGLGVSNPVGSTDQSFTSGF